MLQEFAEALEPLHAAAIAGVEGSGPSLAQAFEGHLLSHRDETADALLSVTDGRAQRAKNRTLKKTYEKLRGVAQGHVTAAVPGLARTLAPFV